MFKICRHEYERKALDYLKIEYEDYMARENLNSDEFPTFQNKWDMQIWQDRGVHHHGISRNFDVRDFGQW